MGGIRVKILLDYIYVEKKDANGDVSYSKCITNQIRDPHFHNMAIVSNNQREDTRVSNINVESIYFKNYNGDAYNDPEALKMEKLELSARNKNIKRLEDGTYHPADLMAHKIQQHMEEENRRALTFLNPQDDKLEMLFKHYETLVSYHHSFEELVKKSKEYREQEEYEGHWALSTKELGEIQTKLDSLSTKASGFVTQFDQIKGTVMQTFNAQLEEYLTSVDNNPNYGLDIRIAPQMKALHGQVDDLIERIDKLKKEGQEYYDEYNKQLDNKSEFYKT